MGAVSISMLNALNQLTSLSAGKLTSSKVFFLNLLLPSKTIRTSAIMAIDTSITSLTFIISSVSFAEPSANPATVRNSTLLTPSLLLSMLRSIPRRSSPVNSVIMLIASI